MQLDEFLKSPKVVIIKYKGFYFKMYSNTK